MSNAASSLSVASTTEEKLGIEQFLKKVVFPILYDWEEKGIDQIGTGTLFAIDARYFIITARHLFKDGDYDYDPKHLAYADNPLGPKVFTLGNTCLMLPTVEAVDVALIEILEAETISRLRAGWQFLSPNNIEAPSYVGQFLLSGYPKVGLRKRGDLLGGTLVSIYTERFRSVPPRIVPAATAVDMFFHYDDEATLLSGETTKTPDLQGMSGASVWKYEPDRAATLWTPENTLRVIGIQSAFSRRLEYFRAVHWLAVARMFNKANKRLGDLVVDAFKTRERLARDTESSPTRAKSRATPEPSQKKAAGKGDKTAATKLSGAKEGPQRSPKRAAASQKRGRPPDKRR
jgi:hypothetical protein